MIILVLLGACGGSTTGDGGPSENGSGEPAEATVNVGMVTGVPLYWLLYIAEDRFASEENLTIELTVTRSAPNVVQQTAGGSLDIGLTSPDSVIAAAQEADAELVMFAGNTKVAPWDLFTKPDIKDVADVAGRTLGATTTTTGEVVVLKQMLENHGLSAGDDYDLVTAGASPDRLKALQRGVIDGGVFAPPQSTIAEQEGFNRLLSGHEELPDYQFHIFVANPSWLEDESDIAARFLKSIIRAGRWLYDPENKEEAAQILSDSLGLDIELGRDAYDRLISEQEALSREAEISVSGVEAAAEAAGLDADDVSQYIDTTYRDAAVEELSDE